MDSIFIEKFIDRINRILRIFFLFRFLEETGKTEPAFSGKLSDDNLNCPILFSN
jgi:hypothetical protein